MLNSNNTVPDNKARLRRPAFSCVESIITKKRYYIHKYNLVFTIDWLSIVFYTVQKKFNANEFFDLKSRFMAFLKK